jgi:hypothetical protein
MSYDDYIRVYAVKAKGTYSAAPDAKRIATLARHLRRFSGRGRHAAIADGLEWRWRPGPEAEQRRLKRRFGAVTRRLERAAMLDRISGLIAVWSAILMRAMALVLVLGSLLRWPSAVVLKQVAAWPSCASGHAVGLTPARRGDPGYWWWHDADGDGAACEWMPDR